MRMKMMLIRTLTATVLFLVLAKVNVWADTRTHLVLAVGYRAFLLAAPIFLALGLSGAMRASLALSALAVGAAIYSVNELTMGLLAIGMAVSGYLAKVVATHTSEGAADNKVSLNIGSLFSGLLLLLAIRPDGLLAFCSILLVVTLALAWRIDWGAVAVESSKPASQTRTGYRKRFLPMLGWSLIGIATGIKLTGIFAVLPQYLIANLGVLPQWFGALVIVNSLIVILIQHRVLRVLDRLGNRATFLVSLSAMSLLAAPALFQVNFLPMALFWITLLTLGECALSRYDRTAKEAGYLFPKELMVGVGSFASVWLSRSFPHLMWASGALGSAALVLGVLLSHPGFLSTAPRLMRRNNKGFFIPPKGAVSDNA
jgi:hypothetical protein